MAPKLLGLTRSLKFYSSSFSFNNSRNEIHSRYVMSYNSHEVIHENVLKILQILYHNYLIDLRYVHSFQVTAVNVFISENGFSKNARSYFEK